MEIYAPEADYGVIIGRFQVDALHPGHKDMIEGICARHKQVLILLGVAGTVGESSNPLDFRTRKHMIETAYPNVLVAALGDIPGRNDLWSKDIDEIIRRMFAIGSVLLYGGRESFIPHYQGKFKCVEIASIASLSGTEVREQLRTQYPETPEGRAGAIYALENRYANGIACADVVAVRGREILLGRKKTQLEFRMLGGFFDPEKDNSFEDTAKREFSEESGMCEISDVTYFQSRKIDDHRYRDCRNKIVSCIFLGTFVFGSPKGTDDIEEIRWFNIDTGVFDSTTIRASHLEAVLNIVEHLKSQEA